MGALPGGLPIATVTTPRTVAPFGASRRPRPVPSGVRRRRFLTEVANHAMLTALMTDAQARTANVWPAPFRWNNFVDVFHRIPLLRYTFNTATIATLATLGVVLSCIPVAYALSRMRWRGREAAFVVVLSTLMLPVQVTIVPLYILSRSSCCDSSSSRSRRSSPTPRVSTARASSRS